MKNILITGFSPFGDYSENISEVAAMNLKTISDYDVYGLVFSTKIFSEEAPNSGELIVKRAQEIKASAIISLGVSSDVTGFRIESIANNWVENNKYCLEEENKRLINQRFFFMEEVYPSLSRWHFGKLWNLDNLRKQINEAGLKCESQISTNAGNYCCNALMFRTLVALVENKCDIPYLFLHVPCSFEAVKNISNFDKNKDIISLETLKRSLEIILQNLE